MSQYAEKIIEAEEKATQLIKQLEKLKNLSQNYSSASITLSETREDLLSLINNVSGVVVEEKNLINSLKEIGTDQIIREIGESKSQIEAVEAKLNALEMRQTVLLSQLKIYIYIALGLIVISTILNIVL